MFTQVQKKRHTQRPVVAHIRDTYASTSRKHVSTETNKISFQSLNNKTFRFHFPIFIFKKM